jgi:Initiator Replication protein
MATENKDPRTLLFISNRWVNSIYSQYGIIKQRILLELLNDPNIQKGIKASMNGNKNLLPPGNEDIIIPLDMRTIVYYNNYHQVRKAVEEMSRDTIEIYLDPTYKGWGPESYRTAPLLHGFDSTKDRRIINIKIKRSIIDLILQVDRKNGAPLHYTKFDKETIRNSSCKYMLPMYTMLCSYGEKQGFTMSIEQLRLRLQIEEKYQGFDNMNKFILKHLQKELQISGKFIFNFTPVRIGKKVTALQFKVIANKSKLDPNHAWLKIQRALEQELPYFMRFTPEQREQFNYLLTGNYDLDQAVKKLHHIHQQIIKNKQQLRPVRNVFKYTLEVMQTAFPPG